MNEQSFNDLVKGLVDFCSSQESSIVNLRRQLKSLTETELKAQISEDRFNCLRWEDEKHIKQGDVQVAYERKNFLNKWSHAFNILFANNSLITNPFHEEGYRFRYWIHPEKYQDRIFRKKLTNEEAMR